MSQKLITIFGATGQQGQGLVNALLKNTQYKIRAISRTTENEKAKSLTSQGVEVVAANLNDPNSLDLAMKDAHGVFLVTNYWDKDSMANELAQVENAVKAAKVAGVEHFIWSTLPNTDEISNGKYNVPHFTNKALANKIVSDAGFKFHTFVEAPSFFQNFISGMGPTPTGEGNQKAWTLPIDPNKKVLHAGDIGDLGKLVLAAFENPLKVGSGQTLSLAAGLFSWQDLADILNQQGHNIIVNQVPAEIYDHFFEGAAEIRQMMQYFEDHTYFGPNGDEHFEAAQALIGDQITSFSDWAKTNMPA